MKRYLPALLGCCLLSACANHVDGYLDVSGQIEGIEVDAGSRVGGRVEEVLASEGDTIQKGEIVLRLESHETEAALEGAQANLDRAEATLDKIREGARPEQLRQAKAAAEAAQLQYEIALEGSRTEEIRAAEASLDAAEAQRDDAQSEYGRAKRLYDEEAISERMFEQAKHAYDAAEAQYNAAKEQRDLVVKGLRDKEISMARAKADQAQAAYEEVRNGARIEDIRAAEAARDAAEADVQRAKSALREMRIRAPNNGLIESLDVRPGDLVSPGPVVRIIDSDELELVVYVSSLALGHIQVGQEIELTTDAHGPKRFQGVIVRIASQGEYTPRNLQTEEERAQQVFAVKLRVPTYDGELRAGMTTTAHIPVPRSVESVQ